MRTLTTILLGVVLCLGLVVSAEASPSSAYAATKVHSPVREDVAWPMPNEQFTVVGNIGTKLSRIVALRKWHEGAWKKIATSKTDAHGRYSFSLRAPNKKIRLRVTAERIRRNHRTYPRVISRYSVFRTLPQGAKIDYLPSTIAVNQSIEVEIATNANRRTRAVVLQAQTDSTTWVSVATGYTNNFGRVWLKYTPTRLGTLRLRAHLVPWHGVAAYDGPSAATTVTVS